jgi:hypothetical protein
MLINTSGDPYPDSDYSQSWLLLQKRWEWVCSCNVYWSPGDWADVYVRADRSFQCVSTSP